MRTAFTEQTVKPAVMSGPHQSTAVDTSTPATTPEDAQRAILAENERQERRRETFRKSQAKRRQRLSDQGAVTITLTLVGDQALQYIRCEQQQRGALEGFAQRALLTGAKFLANSGNPRGSKVKGVSR